MQQCFSRHNSAASFEQLESKLTSLSPESTAKTSDSGIECLASRLTDDHHQQQQLHLSSSSSSSQHDVTLSGTTTAVAASAADVITSSTGNAQVDTSLLWHLGYCLQLLQSLGGRRVLKCKEAKTIDKLQRQADVIEHLIKTAKQNPGHVRDLQSGTLYDDVIEHL